MEDPGADKWESLIRRYAIGNRSDIDMSVAVARMIERLSISLPDVEIGYDVRAHFDRPPFRYLYIGNKVTGPYNIPQEKYRFVTLTECEFTFWQTDDNTVRFRYFIQLTHGTMIHGFSWVKANKDVKFNDSDFKPILDFLTPKIIAEENSSDKSHIKDRYGIWLPKRTSVGVMHNFPVKGFDVPGHCMDSKAEAKMLYLMNRTYSFLKKNKQEIINKINKFKQQ